MYLRNKKTGEIGQIGYVATNDGAIIVEDISGSEYPFSVISNYKTLTKLNEDWEDYKPAEPLIRGERSYEVRTAIRAFGEAIQEKKHILVIKQCGLGMAEFSNGSRFWIRLPLNNETMDALEDGTYYTIDELCGEEEE